MRDNIYSQVNNLYEIRTKFDLNDGGSTLFRNPTELLSDYTASGLSSYRRQILERNENSLREEI
jgi:hypothetical protein